MQCLVSIKKIADILNNINIIIHEDNSVKIRELIELATIDIDELALIN